MNRTRRSQTLWAGAILALSASSSPAWGQGFPSPQGKEEAPRGSSQGGGPTVPGRDSGGTGAAEPGTAYIPGAGSQSGAGAGTTSPYGEAGAPSPYSGGGGATPSPYGGGGMPSADAGAGGMAPAPSPFAGAGAGAGAGAAAAAAPSGGGGGGSASPAAGLGQNAAPGALATIGDQSPFMFAAVKFPPLPSPQPLPGGIPGRSPYGAPNETGQLLFRQTSLKIADNQSPRPVDRVYFNYNYFNNFNGDFNKRYGLTISDIKVDHYVFGVEKTFLDGAASLGLRLPLNNVRLNSRDPRIGSSSTSLNDLSVYAKVILAEDTETGSLLSAGIDINTPTGPGQFAGSPAFKFYNSTVIQPYVGYVFNAGKFYLQGFSSIAVPTNDNDSVMLFNDVGLGYRLYEDYTPGALFTALIPTIEFHVNTPLSHRGIDPWTLTGSVDVLNMTAGCHLRMGERVMFTAAYVRPLTGPTIFDYEVVAMANIFFGQPRSRSLSTPPVVGGF